MSVAKIFTNGRSQAVRLPKEYRFNTEEVYINKVGEATVIFPKNKGWEVFENSLNKFSADFMDTREQPTLDDNRKKT